MKRKTSDFLECAKDSLVLAIEMFNRPSDAGRVEAVLLLLSHAFEMLLKAVIHEKTGRIRGKGEKYNYAFEKCLGICESQLSVIDKDESLVLRNVNGFRDAAAHDVVTLSEGLLYGHSQSAVQIFATLLKKVFNKDIGKWLPRRILPISTVVPADIHTIIEEDMAAIRSLLGGRRRKEDEAEAKLRPYQVIESNIRKVQGGSQDTSSTSRIIKKLKSGDWKTVMPMVAGLVQPTTGGIPITLHVTKKEGFPVRIDPSAPTAIAFRWVKPEDKYPYLTTELADKLDITPNKFVGLVKLFQMKGNDEYHMSIKSSKTSLFHRYSEKAYKTLSQAIMKEGVDSLWTQAKSGKTLNAQDYAT